MSLMIRENPARVALLLIGIVLGYSALGSIASAETFDEPVRKAVVILGRSPNLMPNNPSRIQLNCFYYPDFMVKELNDPGMKGVRWVTITPALKGQLPTCRLSHGSTERFIDNEEWWGFEGVKDQLLFLRAADGDENEGMVFRVLDWKTGKKVFEDSEWWNDHLEFVKDSDGRLSIKYLRVVGGACSIPKEGTSCWNKITKQFGLPPAPAPKCTGSSWEEAISSAEEKEPSAIGYPVVVDLFPQPSINAVTGPVKCSQV